MKKVLFCGCSYVAGSGFSLEKEEPTLWVNLLHQQGKFSGCELINASVPGRSNAGIFQDAVYNLTSANYDYAVICWTSVPRFEFELGVELYATRVSFIPNCSVQGVGLNQVIYTEDYLNNIRDRFLTLISDHYEIEQLVYYVNSLVNLAKLTNTKIFFVNSIGPWDQNYFTKLDNILPSEYTAYTRSLLSVDNRDDEQILNLYNEIHNDYNKAGGIQKNYWLNLYTSLRSLRIDTNDDGVHPGVKSNQIYFELLNHLLEL